MDSKRVSQAEPTIEEIESWDENDLVDWIKQRYPKLLKGDDFKKLTDRRVDGVVFLKHAGDEEYFCQRCRLAGGTSERLAEIARELVGEETARKRKRQQNEDADLSSRESPVSPKFQAEMILTKQISLRSKTVEELAELVNRERVVHVRGTPSTGKTTLAFLLRQYYINHGQQVVLFSRPCAPKGVTLTSYLLEQCRNESYFGDQLDDIIFIIDEAQTGYSYVSLWEYMKLQRHESYGPKFCTFTVYGSPSEMSSTLKTYKSPDPLHLMAQVSILSSREGDIRLFYSEGEFDDVIARYLLHPNQYLPLDETARAYLYSITSGHPGAVHSMLRFLNEFYRPQIQVNLIKSITENDISKLLMDDEGVFSSLTQRAYPVSRSFPKQNKLTEPAVKVLTTILQEGQIPFDYEDVGIKRCFEKGWIHVNATDENNPFCFLPSRLHEKYIEYFIAVVKKTKFPNEKFPELSGLCMAVFTGFSKNRLILSSVDREPTTAAARTVESQYQVEFYRAFISLLGNGAGISSEWSRNKSGNSGRIDFRILGPNWGVELLRDGTEITLDEHYKRFKPKGRYYHWIENGLITDWIVIDCRCSEPEGYTESRPKLWHAVFAKNYSTLRVVGADGKEIMPKVHLMG